MTITLRGVLAILGVGLGVEALVTLYLGWGQAYGFPLVGWILGVGPVLTLVGLFVLWAGRSHLSVVSPHQFRAAGVAFGVSVAALFGAVGLVGWYTYQGATTLPALAAQGFEIAGWASLCLTFATFGLIAFRLSGVAGRIFAVAALAWAVIVCGWIASVLTGELPLILQTIASHSMNVGPINAPVTALETYLAPTYLLLIAAYGDAIRHLGVVRVETPVTLNSRPAA
jgi:hypothetical protein